MEKLILRQNPRARGEHSATQLVWLAAWLLVTYVCPVYLVEERCFVEWSFSCWEGAELKKVGG